MNMLYFGVTTQDKILDLKGKCMENKLSIVYVFNTTDGLTELRVLANSVEQRNGWILAFWGGQVVCGVKEEYLKAFYLEVDS